MRYKELKDTFSKEINDFPIAYAFDKEQFEKAKKKLGVTSNKELLNIGTGGFIKKTDELAFVKLLDSFNARTKEFLKDYENFKHAISYELNNHEYAYTYDLEPVMQVLGLVYKELTDIQKETIEECKQKYLEAMEVWYEYKRRNL